MDCPTCNGTARCTSTRTNVARTKVHRSWRCLNGCGMFTTEEIPSDVYKRLLARATCAPHNLADVARRLRGIGFTDDRITQLTGVRPHELEITD